jgi:Rhodopirellula transposase DDE domain
LWWVLIIKLIVATVTTTGLKVYARFDDRSYPRGVEVTDQELIAVNIIRNPFHGEWNYTFAPSATKS